MSFYLVSLSIDYDLEAGISKDGFPCNNIVKINIGSECTLGRDSTNHVQIISKKEEQTISRIHCHLRAARIAGIPCLSINDCDSLNGVFIDGVKNRSGTISSGQYLALAGGADYFESEIKDILPTKSHPNLNDSGLYDADISLVFLVVYLENDEATDYIKRLDTTRYSQIPAKLTRSPNKLLLKMPTQYCNSLDYNRHPMNPLCSIGDESPIGTPTRLRIRRKSLFSTAPIV